MLCSQRLIFHLKKLSGTTFCMLTFHLCIILRKDATVSSTSAESRAVKNGPAH